MNTMIAFAPHTIAIAVGIAAWVRCGGFHETFGFGLPTWRNTAIATGMWVAVMAAVSFGPIGW